MTHYWKGRGGEGKVIVLVVPLSYFLTCIVQLVTVHLCVCGELNDEYVLKSIEQQHYTVIHSIVIKKLIIIMMMMTMMIMMMKQFKGKYLYWETYFLYGNCDSHGLTHIDQFFLTEYHWIDWNSIGKLSWDVCFLSCGWVIPELSSYQIREQRGTKRKTQMKRSRRIHSLSYSPLPLPLEVERNTQNTEPSINTPTFKYILIHISLCFCKQILGSHVPASGRRKKFFIFFSILFFLLKMKNFVINTFYINNIVCSE